MELLSSGCAVNVLISEQIFQRTFVLRKHLNSVLSLKIRCVKVSGIKNEI